MCFLACCSAHSTDNTDRWYPCAGTSVLSVSCLQQHLSKRLSQQPAHRARASQRHQPAAAATQTLLRVAVLGCLSHPPTNPSIHPPTHLPLTPVSLPMVHDNTILHDNTHQAQRHNYLAGTCRWQAAATHTARQCVQTVINAEALQLFKLSASIGNSPYQNAGNLSVAGWWLHYESCSTAQPAHRLSGAGSSAVGHNKQQAEVHLCWAH